MAKTLLGPLCVGGCNEALRASLLSTSRYVNGMENNVRVSAPESLWILSRLKVCARQEICGAQRWGAVCEIFFSVHLRSGTQMVRPPQKSRRILSAARGLLEKRRALMMASGQCWAKAEMRNASDFF